MFAIRCSQRHEYQRLTGNGCASWATTAEGDEHHPGVRGAISGPSDCSRSSGAMISAAPNSGSSTQPLRRSLAALRGNRTSSTLVAQNRREKIVPQEMYQSRSVLYLVHLAGSARGPIILLCEPVRACKYVAYILVPRPVYSSEVRR